MRNRSGMLVSWAIAAMLLASQPALGAFHLWDIVEVYSNADGSVQFIELSTSSDSQQFLQGHTITASSDGNVVTFNFPTNSPSPTSGRRLLIATPGFSGEVGAVTPDYILDSAPFFDPAAGDIIVNFGEGADVQTFSGMQLPDNGLDSLNRNGASLSLVAPNTPTNFAGDTGEVGDGIFSDGFED